MSVRILVVGEKFIDRYHVGTCTRLSPEAPVPVVNIEEVIQSFGGAGNVSENLKALGATVTEIFQPSPYPIKNRLIANNQQLVRWDEHDMIAPFDPYKMKLWTPFFVDKDALVISDYNKGAINHIVAALLLRLADKIPYIFIDTKTPTKYSDHKGTFFFPNMKEWKADEVEYRDHANVIRTESENGMSYYTYGRPLFWKPAEITKVNCVSGAGDTALAAFAYNYCSTRSVTEAMEFALKACAVSVSKPYTSTVTHDEIKNTFE